MSPLACGLCLHPVEAHAGDGGSCQFMLIGRGMRPCKCRHFVAQPPKGPPGKREKVKLDDKLKAAYLEDATSIACAYCGAEQGQACHLTDPVHGTTKERQEPHKVRVGALLRWRAWHGDAVASRLVPPL